VAVALAARPLLCSRVVSGLGAASAVPWVLCPAHDMWLGSDDPAVRGRVRQLPIPPFT